MDGYYQIRNVGHLYWFAQTVNEGNTTINGKLMENIVINKNVLKADGTLNGGEFRSWTPIGTTDNQYAGTFDGNGKTISGLYYNVGRNNIGFFSYTNGAEIRNLGIVDSYIKAQTWIGGVVCNASNSTISNCYYAGSISGSQSAAGIVSNLFNNSTISNCYNIGIVRSTFHPGSVVCGVRESTVSNCYYLTGTADNGISSGTGEATAKTEAEFASGEVAYLLGKAWGQKIGTDAYPVLGGEVVYKNGDTYANTCAHPSYTNQKCDACGEPCSHASYTDGQCNACGKICIHESYTNSKCDECGKICAHESYTDQKCDVCGEPCSHVSYTDGQCSACGKICMHESYTDSKCDECVKICAHESYTDQKCDVCGEPCAHEYCDKGFCSTCGGYEEPELKDGVYQISNAGQLYWFAKKVNGGDNAINGKLTKNIVINENVLNADGTLNGTPSREWTPIGNTSRKYIGTFDGDGYTISGLYINNSEKLHVGLFGFVWDGTVQNTGVLDSYFCAKKFVGGVAGYVYNSIFSNNYNAGTISGSSYVGGVAGHLIYDTIASNCYNTGIVSGSERVGGVTGYVNEFSSLSNCYNIGSVTGSNNVGSVTGEVAIGSTAKNCYYLTGTADSGIGYGQGEAIAKTEAEFASGEVAYLLGEAWGQTIGTDAYPVLGGEAVYQVADCVGDLAYSNTQMDLKHNYVDGICVVCGAQEEVQNVYTITYTQASISLAGDIGLNYYATLSEDLMADEGAYIVFTVAGEKQIVPISDAIVSTGNNGELTYRFSCKVVAKQMTEQVVGQMYTSDGTAVGEAKAFSVKAYCDKAIEVYSSYSQYANLVNLMKAMLNYGGYSQIQLGHNIDNLANADLADTSLPEITGADLAAYAHGKEGSESGISIMQVSLLLNSTTTIRYYFQLDGTHPIEDYTFVVDGKAAAPVLYRDNIYYVDKVDIAAKDLDVNSYVEVGGLKVWYCGMSYVRQILNTSTDTNLINVCKALYAYSEAANAYFD